MSFVKEFKDFIAKGNVLDLAVGVIIGAAFGKIVASMVSDILMPPIGLLTGGIDFKEMKLVLKEAVVDAAGKVVTPSNTINYGNFISVLIEFLIIALFIFTIVKMINRLKNEPAVVAEAPAPTQDQVLLTEIRDLLKK
jgi:large conductance mechanosensitive channel